MTDAPIHPKSQLLLDRVSERLDDEEFMALMLDRLVEEVRAFFMNTPLHALKALLLSKMVKGAQEHGEPNYSPREIKSQKQEEMLDIIGWDFTGEDLNEKPSY